MDPGLFSLRSFTLGSLISLTYFAGFTTVFFLYALYLQNGVGYSALASGLTVLPFAAASAVGAAAGGRLVVRFGRKLVVIGLGGVALGLLGVMAAVALVPGPNLGWASALPLLVGGIGSGLTVSPNTTLTLTRVPVQRAGAAGGVLQTGQRVGSAAGIAVVGSVYFAHLANHGRTDTAMQLGLLSAVGIIMVALLLAVADLRERHVRPEPEKTAEPAGPGRGEGGAVEGYGRGREEGPMVVRAPLCHLRRTALTTSGAACPAWPVWPAGRRYGRPPCGPPVCRRTSMPTCPRTSPPAWRSAGCRPARSAPAGRRPRVVPSYGPGCC